MADPGPCSEGVAVGAKLPKRTPTHGEMDWELEMDRELDPDRQE